MRGRYIDIDVPGGNKVTYSSLIDRGQDPALLVLKL